MHTLEQLRKGELKGIKQLTLSENLTTFPEEIFLLADNLEVLDLSNNRLMDLPDDLWRLHQLKILFASNNQFRHVPEGVGRCAGLTMIGFKHNHIEEVSETCLPPNVRWLILTDNRIQRLPENLGSLKLMEKLALAGNRLEVLPESMGQLRQLGLLRISANALAAFPDVVLTLPRLAWLAFSGNPFCPERRSHSHIRRVQSSDVVMHDVLGRGASGVISRATWRQSNVDAFVSTDSDVAIKVFHGDVTSDGYPEDELDACLSVGAHPNLVAPLARIQEPNCNALVMKLIPDDYSNLGQPPSLASCTRDTFTQGQCFTREQADYLIEQMQSLVGHLEAAEISHGDLYAHNVLVRSDGHALFSDFGAASRYSNLTPVQAKGIRTIERRSLAHFIEDVEGLVGAVEKSECVRQ